MLSGWSKFHRKADIDTPRGNTMCKCKIAYVRLGNLIPKWLEDFRARNLFVSTLGKMSAIFVST